MRIVLKGVSIDAFNKVTASPGAHPLFAILESLNESGTAYTVSVVMYGPGTTIHTGPVYPHPHRLVVRTDETPPTVEVINPEDVFQVDVVA